MEGGTVLRSSSTLARPSNFTAKSTVFATQRPDFVSFRTKSSPSTNGWIKNCPSFSTSKQGQRRFGSRRLTCVRASSTSDANGSSSSAASIAPLQLESPIGQFLSQILMSHPHLLPAAVDQQLQQLKIDREAEQQKEDPSTTTGTELVLYRRIAELKANERRKALEEILYALIVQKFMDAGVSLIPTISQPSDPSGRVDSWPSQEQKLVELHSPEAYEMIKNHLALILGNRLEDSNSVAQISKLRVGQVYAASVMYGYFLKRVDQRFQLEKTMKTLPFGSDGHESSIEHALPDESRPNVGAARVENASWSGGYSPGGFGYGVKATKLRSYVMSFDAETLQRYATIRSKEAVGIIEKHTEALFGRPEIVITPRGGIDSSNDEVIKISFAGLQRLVLEAVTFGSFLWDVESYVDSRYHFVAN
ncbi:UV-B-induced protein At3g17800, chloroplastic-like [Magnolia sinica]|uniref:UV-B-induced protein At3g17800, chloroplastic-like n=1 Tax=Magnolia sinica TaxID=86752 RepID=UPI0026584563|nr:UV-B-induced protein At3g17800, chloroplastic-like [Magnolia sinica]XP_058078497.1 UV-B-induced protein At3g17800, chloroplastic-like [Magnolia sinica]